VESLNSASYSHTKPPRSKPVRFWVKIEMGRKKVKVEDTFSGPRENDNYHYILKPDASQELTEAPPYAPPRHRVYYCRCYSSKNISILLIRALLIEN
jgi:hypothetical protein